MTQNLMCVQRNERYKLLYCFSLDGTSRGNTPRRLPRLAKVKLRTKLFEKLRATKAHEERRLHGINVLQDVKEKIDNFQLAVSSEVELISANGHAAFLSISASHKKEFSACAGIYLPVTLLISEWTSSMKRCKKSHFQEIREKTVQDMSWANQRRKLQ